MCIKVTKARDIKRRCVEYLGGKCKHCGQIYHPIIYDFDHREPQHKEFKISGKAIYRWKELKKELDKCDLLCSNCHRLRHYLEEFPENIDS